MRPLLAAALVLSLSVACAASAAAIRATVTIEPQAYFVERVGGELVDVDVLVGPGQSPHTYEPTPRQMARLAESDVYFTIGLPFEEALRSRVRELAPDLAIVATDYPVPKRPMDGADGEAHDDDDGHGHDDPHIWLDPGLVKIQAGVIATTLERLDPTHADIYRANLDRFDADLDSLDADIATALAPSAGDRIYVFHPSFGYFADAYGLVQVAVETGGKEPSARQLAALIDHARADRARVVFVQPQFSTTAATAVAEAIDGVVVPIDPLARSYMENLRSVATAVREGLGGGNR